MCMLTNSGAVAHYHTSLNLPASSVPSKSLTALVQLVHQSRTYSTRQASLLISGRTCLIQEQLTGTSVSRSPAPAKLASKQGVHSSFQTTSSTRNKRPQFHSPWFCSASASPATLADALRSQQKQAVHLICLASTVAALLLNPASCLASETCQAPQLGNSAHQSSPETQCIAGIADLPGSFADQADPVNPFTLFGNTRKKFLIENLEGSKVISRKKGFTTKTCVSGVPTQQQTKQFESLPLSAKADEADTQLCSKTTGPDLKEACAASCGQACTAALKDYTDKDSKFTGYSINAKAKDKLSKSCAKQCTYECAKPGDKYGFAIPFR